MKQPAANALLKSLLALGYVGVVLRKPLTWLVLLVALVLWWTLRQHREAQREASRPPPVEFAAAQPKSPPAETPKEPGETEDEGMKEEPAVIPSPVLETAVGRFHRDHRRVPKDFEELQEGRYIAGVPKPPPGMRYQLDLRRMKLRLVRADLVPRS
jgi:hypothetical protein